MFSFLNKKSPCNVYFFGGRDTGSWKIRGEQVASTRRNWTCSEEISAASLKKNDIFVAVKRLRKEDAEMVKGAGKILVHDVIDSWHHPEGASDIKNAEGARKFFAAKWSGLPIDSSIFANKKMWADLSPLVPHSTFIYHHYYPKLKPTPLSEKVRFIGYQGKKRYLANWAPSIKKVSEKMGLEFITNPRSLMDLDIGFIARGGDCNGFMEQNYKSNVKLTNLMACGIPPLILSDSVSCHEIWNREETYFSSEEEMELKLDALVKNRSLRQSIHNDLLEKSKQFQLSVIANQYEEYFTSLMKL